jgi:transposase-like protein
VSLVGDLAAEALAQSSLQSHDHRMKCPKCGSTNVIQLENIRRRKAEMVTWPTGG